MKKLNVTIVAGLLVAVVGAALVLAYGMSVDKRIADGRRLVDVVVAVAPIEAGASTDAVRAATKVEKVPAEYVADGALTTLDGMQAAALRGPVAKGQQLTTSSFGTAENGGAALVQPSKGNVALAIEVGLSPGVARYINPGSAVDMFVTYAGGGSETDGSGAASSTDRRTKLFASGVRVLSVSVAPPQVTTDESGAVQTTEQNPGRMLAVLDVSPVVAERIVNASELGKIYLALSTDGATHTTQTGVTPADVVNANR
jgi:Flp pilus assembly protein CpaB